VSRHLPTLLACILLLGADRAAGIPCLSGFVRGPGGVPVAGADLDFTIAATGVRLVTPGDNTDISGFYTVCVLPNVYEVAYAPPPGTRLLGVRFPAIDLTGDAGLVLDVDLAEGMITTGTVLDAAGLPVADVDLDVDRVEGGRLYTPGDNTALDGTYHVVVPAGFHRFRFEPPRGSRLRGAEIDSVDVTSDAVLDVVLTEGLLLTGRLTDVAGQPAFDVDVDLRDAVTGEKVYLANAATDVNGDYTVAAPPGTFLLRYAPPRTSRLVAVDAGVVDLAADMVRDQVLATGHLVTVTILGTGDLPLQGSDLDVKDAATGAKLFTPHDRADAGGRTVAALPTGLYDLIVDAPPGANYAGAFLPGVAISADTDLVVRLAGAPRVTVQGRVVDADGAPVAEARFAARASLDGEEIRLADDRTAVDGTFSLDLPPVPVDLTLAPPFGTRLVGRRFDAALAENDTIWADIVMEAGFLVTVTAAGPSGRPVPHADIDFRETESGLEIFTPDDNTDTAGAVTVAIPSGSFRLDVTPPPGSGFGPAGRSGVIIDADCTLAVVLPTATGGGAVVLDAPGPNPFRERSVFAYRLAAPTTVVLSVYDLRGRLVREIRRGARTEGAHNDLWDGQSDDGARAPSGMYFLRVESPLGSDTRRLTLIR